MKDIELKRGQALVIAGAVGSGKTRLARAIAEKGGEYRIERQDVLSASPLVFGAVLEGQPATVIFDDVKLPLMAVEELRIHQMLSQDEITIERKHRESEQRRTQNVILCTSGRVPRWMTRPNARFVVFRIGRQATVEVA